MFDKVPYGVKVRVRGSDELGYVAECAIHYNRFLPFMNTWIIIKRFDTTIFDVRETYATFDEAKDAAMKKYDEWIRFYQGREEEERAAKNMKKISKTPIWEHP